MLRQRQGCDGVARLVVGGQLPLPLGHHTAALFGTGEHLDHRLADVLHGDHLAVASSGQQRRLVQQIFQIGAGKSRSAAGHLVQIHILSQRLFPHMDVQDLPAALDVRQTHIDLAVKASRAQQRRVEDIHPVGGGQHHNAFVGTEAVHLHQQLVESLLTLVVAAAQTAAALAAHGVDLINKDDGRAILFGLGK